MVSPALSAATTLTFSTVTKRFGAYTALDGLTMAVPEGRITALLGPNGAGKTTAIRLVTGALRADAGAVSVFGLDPTVHGEHVRRRCGVVAAKPALYDRLSGWDNLRYAAALWGLPADDTLLQSAAARFGIDSQLGRRAGTYSTGMKTRLALARATLHQPDLLLLDEPTSGLDPESSLAVLQLVRRLAATGVTVLLCTHLLAEAEGLADHVVVLEAGTVLAAGHPDELVAAHWPDAEVRVVDRAGLAPALLGRLPGVRAVRPEPGDAVAGDSAVVAVLDDLARVPDLVAALTAAGARLERVEPVGHSLEDLYFAVRRVARGAMTAVAA